MANHDHNQAGNALYVDPPRNLFKKLVIEFIVVVAALALPMWAVGHWRLLDGPPSTERYWTYVGIAVYYTAWALGFGLNFLRKAWLTASSGRHPHLGAFVFQRTRVRYGAPATMNATLYAAIGVAILYAIVHVWLAMGIPAAISAGVPVENGDVLR